MRCPQCGYHSFDELSACKKCGTPLLARHAGRRPDAPVEGQLFSPEELKKRAEIFSTPVKALSGMSPLRAVEKQRQSGAKDPSCSEQMALPSFLLDDPHETTNNWEGWSAAEPQELPVQLMWRRALATLVDLLALVGLLALFAVVAWHLQGWTLGQWLEHVRQDALLRLACYLLIVLMAFLYFFLGHYLTGQTLGKVLFAVRVVSDNGAPLTMAQTVLRSTGSVLSLLCLGAGFVAIWRDEQQRGWSDRLAGTRIVDSREDGPDALPQTVTEETQ
ncbi:RDD family protein [Desulfuromonas acetoxidans]|uniref:RDD domain protein n=1 Tax=Desulfuromonas acetoxidans (strain DSM 684 / 11070) TaxID=281689 RepID=Q1K3Q5_DESA6|nr:RDD family protein [Desulfuromonas acetoxidans]EAT16919.1 RDD domain protein [Desulfuromonas acetoxidans DSM 684]MBF0644552.1 RDD family protein [Desulfuromonas acetoxidans]NVD23921.1 RDD family protein [Desulfuromonas acetoxidans]NVE16218.1 RDD family protein [Desulfuromonas acetoxidans]